MAEQLFTRDGTPKTANATFNGKPVWRHRNVCFRCGGAGGAERWAHTGWKCYNCGGEGSTGTIDSKLYTADKLAQLDATLAKKHAKRDAARAAEAAAKRAEMDAAWDSWYAANAPACDAINMLIARDEEGNSVRAHRLCDEASAKIARREPCSDRLMDVALSLVVSRLAESDARTASRHVGTIGERREFSVTVDRVKTFEPFPGSYPRIWTYLHLMRDDAGNRIVYKGSKYMAEAGERITFVATVKEFNEYNGEAQTIVARPKEK